MSANQQDQPGRKIGQGMLVASFALGLGALTLFFDGWLANEANPNRDPRSYETVAGDREVVLERNRQGHYVAGGEVNNVPVTFLLDTGATDVAIPASIAERADLRQGTAGRAFTANGAVTVYTTLVDSLRIGNIELQDVRASITPSMPGDTILLGMSALQQVEFSQRGNELTLRQLAN
jgi:aspartyl protease family protein